MSIEMNSAQKVVLRTLSKKPKGKGYAPKATSKDKIEAAEFWLNKGFFKKEGKTYFLFDDKIDEAKQLLKEKKPVKKTTVQAGLLPTNFRSARPIIEDYLEKILSRLGAIEAGIQKNVIKQHKSLRMKLNERQLPLILKQAYDQVKSEESRFSDLIPLSYIKPKLFRKYDVSNEEINKVLLELEKKREIDLQVAYDASEVKNPEFGINLPGRGLIFFVRWRS